MGEGGDGGGEVSVNNGGSPEMRAGTQGLQRENEKGVWVSGRDPFFLSKRDHPSAFHIPVHPLEGETNERGWAAFLSVCAFLCICLVAPKRCDPSRFRFIRSGKDALTA